jgi:hypothetical protein
MSIDTTTRGEGLTAQEMIDDPLSAFAGSYTRIETSDPGTVERLRLEGLKLRFNQLRDRIPTLKKLADRQGIDRIDTVEDVIPLLFEHTMYKSYPSHLLLDKRFDLLTQWLSRLTCADLSEVDATGCNSIDAWLDTLDAKSELRVCHTSGTTGTMSFLPWSATEVGQVADLLGTIFSQTFGVDEDWRETGPIDVVFPHFRRGGSMMGRQNDAAVERIAKSPERFHALYPQRVSADVLYLAARLRAANAKGQAHTLEVDTNLLARKDEFEELMSQRPQRVETFLDEVVAQLTGKRTWTFATPHMLFQMAEAGLSRGRRNVFAADSIVGQTGGGKGWEPPADWTQRTLEFFGASELREMYGMSEIMLLSRACSRGRFHVSPWVIPFILDPDTSEPLPREGVTTGRAAFFDLSAKCRWGGFISGDEVTLNWNHQCPCGRTTLYLEHQIERYSEKRGGSDKINCAATEEAHQEALDYLTRIEVD